LDKEIELQVAASGMIQPVVIASRKGMQRLTVSAVPVCDSLLSWAAGSLRQRWLSEKAYLVSPD